VAPANSRVDIYSSEPSLHFGFLMGKGFPEIEEIMAAYKAYAHQVGRVVFAWNALQETLSKLFDVIVGGDSRINRAIWHKLLSDKTQREILRAAIDAIEPPQEHKWEKRLPNARKELIWLLREATKAGELRNDAIHAPCDFAFNVKDGQQLSIIQAAPHSGNPRAKKLKNKVLLDEFEHYTRVAATLNHYAWGAYRALTDNSVSWPDKPLLPTLGQNRSRKGLRPGTMRR
jgi:hypothetical protein